MLKDLLLGNISEDEYIRSNNVKIFYKKLPKYKRGLIFRYRDINIIFISSYLSNKSKWETLIHEFAHLELNHIDKLQQYIAFSIYDLEDEADKYVDSLKRQVMSLKNFGGNK